jgi:two-component system nitrogen regulation sensor histidine kinase GlnL
MTMPVLVVSRSGRIHHGNPAAAQFWQVTPERLASHTLQQLFGEDSFVCTRLAQALDEESSFTVEPYEFDQGEGMPPLFLRVQIDPVQVPGGQGDLAVVAFWDETHREKLNHREQENRLMDSIGLMTLRLAHELHNPLSGIKGATQLLARHLKDASPYREYPGIILGELERMERLVRNLLLQGGAQNLNPTRFNVHELLDTVIWFQSNSSSRAEYVREYDPSLPELLADKDKLHQVFLNLIQNAEEASPSDAPIIVRTKALGPWRPENGRPDPGRIYYQIEIEDQGQGVSPELQTHLFTPFFTAKKTGTGLGLSISYQIVRAHGGYLTYRPATGRGSVFSVALPMEEAEAGDAP